ncbi:MAG: flagellar assembly protein FliW [Acidobacteria bacterium]|nr:flagellar assembly protein FliW [Acidobacteriota bacterium]
MPETQTLRVQTLSFGEIEVPESKVLTFPEGIPGFPSHRRFVVLSPDEIKPFQYLQALDEPPVAFLIINPFLASAGYEVKLSSSDMDDIGSSDPSELTVYAVVTVPQNPQKSTVNLTAPIVINEKKRIGRQFILQDSGFSVKHPLIRPHG